MGDKKEDREKFLAAALIMRNNMNKELKPVSSERFSDSNTGPSMLKLK